MFDPPFAPFEFAPDEPPPGSDEVPPFSFSASEALLALGFSELALNDGAEQAVVINMKRVMNFKCLILSPVHEGS